MAALVELPTTLTVFGIVPSTNQDPHWSCVSVVLTSTEVKSWIAEV